MLYPFMKLYIILDSRQRN